MLGETLILFAEIQECPEALSTLKYFKEKANGYHVIAAGSLLGTLLAKPKSYPVGMVNLLVIYPLNFEEFLEATAPALYAYYDSIQKEQQIEGFSITDYWKPTTTTSLSAVCRNAWHPGSITKIPQGSPRSSANSSKSMKTTFPNITARSTVGASSWYSAASLHSWQSPKKNSCTALSVRVAERGILKKPSNGSFLPEC